MKADRASRTAQFVALGRAMANAGISHVPNFRDPTAYSFLSDKGRNSLKKVELAVQAGARSPRVEMARAMADMMALRTSAIDDAVRQAIIDGAQQLVILGAGFDGRAWRMDELRGVRVFEVDHIATQRDKRSRVADLAQPNALVSFVPIDFERESLDQVLSAAGHDRAQRTVWIWEGVVMYLTHEAMRATLQGVADRSASGSTLIVNYHSAHRRWFARLIFRLIGEPMISSWSVDEMAADLTSAGFRVKADTGMLDWNARFAGGSAKVDRGAYMRIAIAEK